jgi:type IV fimbrial biogenesis protein FimT
MKRNTGFTLIELMVTLALAAIIVTMAIPSFQEVIRNNRLTTQANELVSALNLARSEAIKRGVRVTVCRSSNGTSCTGNWEQGWIVYSDINGDGVADIGGGNCDPGEDCILRSYGELGGNNTLRGNDNVTNRVTFNPNGFTPGFNGTFNLCDARGVSKARFIVISFTGRLRTRYQQAGDTCP